MLAAGQAQAAPLEDSGLHPSFPFPLCSPSPTPSPTPTASPTPPTGNVNASTGPTPPPPPPPPPPGAKVWPNPFTPGFPPNDHTHFELPAGHAAGQLVVIDLRRRMVRSLNFASGADIQWDGKDNTGAFVGSGVYLYLLDAGGAVTRGTVTVMR